MSAIRSRKDFPRKDRLIGQHGGVCLYIKASIPYEVLDQFHHPALEVLWVKTRPHRLPKGLSCIIVGTVYHPPSAHAETMINFLLEQLASMESTYSNCGFIILGDFNNLDVGRIKNQFRLKQLIQFHTRGNRTLYLILTNLKKYYQPPVKLPPFGLSDHFTVLAEPKIRGDNQLNKKTKHSRDLRPSRRAAMSAFINEIDWSILDHYHSCEEKWACFESIINTGMEILLPVKSIKLCNNEPPWMNYHLKSLIHQRQFALASGDISKFKLLRNSVNRERINFFEYKIKQLKSSNPKQWWNSVKTICGMNPICRTNDFSRLIDPSGESNSQTQSLADLANTINLSFLAPMNNFQPLGITNTFPMTPSSMSDTSSVLVTTESEVFIKLAGINSSKASGPDQIPGWLFKENANVLARPVSAILNSSYCENRLPSSWKNADVSPIPKQKPVLDVSKHLRPISLTPVISKLAEEFVVDRFIKPAVLQIIDPQQYGAIYPSLQQHKLS
jgi:hypothetical protein